MNYLWGGMILVAIVVAAFTGRMPDITNAAISSAKEAVMLCITMLGVLSMWSGLMKITEKAGLLHALSRRLQPVLHFLFPEIPRNHSALSHISTNFIANFLGLGWAATPAGLKAMESLQSLNSKKDTASKSMCTFMILNMSSLQLVTMNIVAYRMQYRSANPSEIIGPGILATLASTVVSVIYCKCMNRWDNT